MAKEKELYTAETPIPKEKFELVHEDESIHDTKFETKPIGWLRDALTRFVKNRTSVVAAAILFIIILFAIIVPLASPKSYVKKSDFPSGFRDSKFSEVLPRVKAFKGSGFWDGTKEDTIGEAEFKLRYYGEFDNEKKNNDQLVRLDDSNYERFKVLKKNEKVITALKMTNVTYKVRVDTYAVGALQVNMSQEEYEALEAYEAKKGISMVTDYDANLHRSILKPLTDYMSWTGTKGDMTSPLAVSLLAEGVAASAVENIQDQMANYYNKADNTYIYYKLYPNKRNGEYVDTSFVPYINSDNEIEDIYRRDGDGNLIYYDIVNSQYRVRVDYYDYFTYRYGFEPNYILGSNNLGQDILLRLAKGTRFSLLLGVGVSLINFLIGLVWGAVSGYYGGRADLIMERVTDIIANVPTIVIMSIASIQLTNNSSLPPAAAIILSFLIAFVYNGWVGVASTTRMQFYRFKGQEYVLASRTLGAKDRRLIFRHILPNAAGTLVTASVLMIPGIIFAESSLSYLGIVDFASSGIDTIGTLLKEGQSVIKSSPHVLIAPVTLIAVLMICFNLFGNGLRDAFNTTLRGSED